MITQENLKKQYNLIKVSFGLKFASKNEEEAYISILFKVLTKHNLTDKNITEGTEKLIMTKTKKDFNEIFGFGCTPAPADFVKFFGGNIKEELNEEDIARMEVEKILFEARYVFSDYVFENETTKKVINSFANGLKTVSFDLFDVNNLNKQNKFFYKKDLVEKWLAYNKQKKFIEIDERIKKVLPNFNNKNK